ncbi:purine and uridine phosphorylase [Aspergillus costaricaensis CBS 115574]|uniref:Purine and uridine phosphorylase n=1 Tax=Aspergillus costaricaensis CBS 115574 TaxID=1448317 RepID=A0ACD1ILZ8_9EURO|nr:purine and uridine phosphorylase [Aspergillus costaricaensis CBS 115574]RAK91133.1 purine and uridine phosphorylase [Aspergillus costaricaensis CBS 115574]
MPWSTTNTVRDNYYAYYHGNPPITLLERREQPFVNIPPNLHRDLNGVLLPESISAQLLHNCVAPHYRTANVRGNTILDVPSPAAGAYSTPTGRQYYISNAGLSYVPNNTAAALWHTGQSSPLPPSTQLPKQPIHWQNIGDRDFQRPVIRDRSQAPVRITNEHAGMHQQWQEHLTDDFIRYRNDAIHHTGLVQAGYSPNRGLENIQFAPGPHSRAIPDFDTMSAPRTQLESRMTEARQYPAHGGLDQFELGHEAATLGSLSPPRPTSRSDFEIAIICALTVEQDAVHALFDHYWDDNGPAYGKHPCDPNAYSCGAIGRHNVVLVHMPGMGKATAAAVAAHCRVSFPNLKLALVVGVCGALPFMNTDQEIILGDVIIGDGIIQYDFGRQYPDQFVRRNTLLDSLGRPSPEIRAHLAKLKSRRGLASLHHAMCAHLRFLQSHPQFNGDYHYPGAGQDVLYKPESNIVVSRRRLEQPSPKPHVHFGAIASGDTLMRSGMRRDNIATKEGIIAFEMEGAGISDNIPHVIIKGVSDYADSHKTKAWQPYAAGTAAACMKAFLESWVPTGRLC